ncbi:SDR family NAD(P)-dependent oxidoreductase [Microbacterium sp. zg.Y909]|uniref:SDR family NAD(P)-dependent oxidoreductase n=1 Tax=Microbacterium sp. zg.Y909 TaxID=2969413 RepID=UPI00214BC5BD|nr:SDR family oxidoreductase [Microbacterium sp. zg.Y909]MCR2824078.1 SDR family oxidoreductase [Microbacterium sp. zg.Y909]
MKGAGQGRVAGKRALVVGGAGAIGSGIVEKLLEEGATVVVGDFNRESLDIFTSSLGNDAVSGVVVDITDQASVTDAVTAAVENLGGGIDILVNATGISHQGTTFDEETVEGWNRVLAVNLTGAFVLIKAAVAHMGAGAAYVMISSTGAVRGLPLNLAYGASKGGMANYTQGLATALAPRGIRVNTVGPGLMEHPVRNGAVSTEVRVGRDDVVPLGRLGTGRDIGNVVCFLASDEASWVTGQSVYVDGGSLAR